MKEQKNDLQINTRHEFIETIVLFSSAELQKSYAESVKFVNVTLELFERWQGFNRKKTYNWFREIFTNDEWLAFEEMDKCIKKNFRNFSKNSVPETIVFITTNEFINIQTCSIETLFHFPEEEVNIFY